VFIRVRESRHYMPPGVGNRSAAVWQVADYGAGAASSSFSSPPQQRSLGVSQSTPSLHSGPQQQQQQQLLSQTASRGVLPPAMPAVRPFGNSYLSKQYGVVPLPTASQARGRRRERGPEHYGVTHGAP
jgi:hypothetical protein